MNKKILIAAIVAVVIIAGGVVHHLTDNNLPSSTVTAASPQSNAAATNSSKVLFSATPYASYSYQVYPGPLSAQAQSAMAGFNLTTNTLANGTTIAKIGFSSTGQSQQFSLLPGYRLYIIETSYGDDSFKFESSLSDDGFVATDSSGYVVS
ncbi:MAG: hypothetical protein KGH60_03890 [Candidatus Micrarchaeota archaeon]|nr:hypothetical protein [Candidatus Micrarchaeota archaeon]